MKSKTPILILISIIIVSNGLWEYFYIKYKHNSELYLNEANRYMSEYSALKTNLTYNISNTNEKLDNIIIYNNHSEEMRLSDLIQGEKEIIICRISDNYCEECNFYSQITLKKLSNKIIYLVNRTKKKGINNIINSYNLDSSRTYGTEKINLSAEKYMFPYYIKLDSNLNVLQVYFPTRQLENLDKELLQEYIK